MMRGFTLIELIVVTGIIGVLVAVLVPSMIGYVNESRLSTANANAKLAYSSTATWCAKSEVNGHPTSMSGEEFDLTASGSPPVYDGSTADLEAALCDLMGGDINSGLAKVTITNSTPTEAKWRKTSADARVGCYPNAATMDSPAVW